MKEGRLRAFIVDDERLQRRELRSMLKDYDSIEVVGEAATVKEATGKIKETDPAVIFLDIQMPGGSGFDLLERLDVEAEVIFITAYDEYAIRAFEVNALDYILKPVEPERLARTVERLTARAKHAVDGENPLKPSDSIYIKTGNRSIFVKVADIVYISAAGDYTEVNVDDGKQLLVSKSIREWERRLPGERFERIHRSTIVNMDKVDHIVERSDSTSAVFMKGLDVPLKMSRRRKSEIKRKLK